MTYTEYISTMAMYSNIKARLQAIKLKIHNLPDAVEELDLTIASVDRKADEVRRAYESTLPLPLHSDVYGIPVLNEYYPYPEH